MKAIIIDDNHSFIDLLKNALQPFRIQIDSCYKFSEARNILLKNGSYFNQTIANEVIKYHENVLKNNDQSMLPLPVLEGPVINPDGYALIFLEYDAEPSMKGTYFIQDLLKNQKEWTEKNFILMSSDPSKVEQTAKKMKIVLIEKPLKKEFMLKMVKDFLQSLAQKENEIKEIILKYGITTKSSEQNTAPVKKKSASKVNKKKTAKPEKGKSSGKKNIAT